MSHHGPREHRINREYRIRVIGLFQPAEGVPDIRNCYLLAYDPDAAGGRGWAEFTNDRDRALTFPNLASAVACYSTQSGTRPDGKPNRPLTALNVTFEPV